MSKKMTNIVKEKTEYVSANTSTAIYIYKVINKGYIHFHLIHVILISDDVGFNVFLITN